jgi:hydroxymethylbilane synthase
VIDQMNNNLSFKLGTRGSPLALWQAERVQALLQETNPGVVIEIVIIQTTGDKILDKPLVQIGDKGLFTKEIEIALLEGGIDLAVHSFKDLPTQLPEGLIISSIPERDSPFDALISRQASSLSELPANPVIATGSLRRKAQILAARPDAEVVDIRGNINTRLQKFHDSDWDALIMAEAGMRRMGWVDKISGVLSIDEMLPAPAQGALAVETRMGGQRTIALVESINDPDTSVGVEAERAFLAELEGGCQVPIAAYSIVDGEIMTLHGLISSLDGKNLVRRTTEAPLSNPALTGRSLAQAIKSNGGQEIIDILSH